jgi:hypothetical protein
MLREAGLQGMAKLCSLEGNPTLHTEGAHCPHPAHRRCSLPHAAHRRCSLLPPCTQKILTIPVLYTESAHSGFTAHRRCSLSPIQADCIVILYKDLHGTGLLPALAQSEERSYCQHLKPPPYAPQSRAALENAAPLLSLS